MMRHMQQIPLFAIFHAAALRQDKTRQDETTYLPRQVLDLRRVQVVEERVDGEVPAEGVLR